MKRQPGLAAIEALHFVKATALTEATVRKLRMAAAWGWSVAGNSAVRAVGRAPA
jgi:hypothetical protein